MSDRKDDWEEMTLGDVAEVINGRAYKLSEWETSGTPVIRLQNLTQRGGDFYFSNLTLPEKQYCTKGDLLYMWSATFGPHIWWGEKAIFHYHIWKIEPNERIDKKFLFYLLNAKTQEWKAAGSGMAMIHLTKAGIEKEILSIPPLREQKKIAEILSGIDHDISMLIDGIHRTLLSKEALLRITIPHPSCDCRKDFMEGWTLCRLEDACSLITYGFTNPMPTTQNGVYMVTAKDVRDGNIDKKTARYTSFEAYKTLLTDKSRPIKNDILITKDGTLGRTAIVRDEIVCINQSVALLRPKEDEFAEYLHLLLSTPQYQQTMLEQAGGSAVKHIYITTLAKMEIALPPSTSERKKIVQTFASLDAVLSAKRRKLGALQNLRLGLGSDLLSGRKRVSI